jgi:hypothetical protein
MTTIVHSYPTNLSPDPESESDTASRSSLPEQNQNTVPMSPVISVSFTEAWNAASALWRYANADTQPEEDAALLAYQKSKGKIVTERVETKESGCGCGGSSGFGFDKDAVDEGEDNDGDGYSWEAEDPADRDCDDSDALIYPGAEEIWYDDVDQDCDDQNDYDADGDGFEKAGIEDRNGNDCDDSDPAISPAAEEICDDGVDQDCDEDNDVSQIWYRDFDGDGFGDEDYASEICASTEGYSLDATDCDDSREDVNTDGEEVCGGDYADEDCDGLVDVADDSVTDAKILYIDRDGDGFGDSDSEITSCDDIEYYVTADDDCDDLQPLAYPGADEVCDEIDNDCDGDTDESDATDATRWYTDADSDGYGSVSSAGTVACDAPSETADNKTDCDDDHAGVNPGEAEVCDEDYTDEDCNGLANDDDSSADGKTTVYADSDGDGYGKGMGTDYCDVPASGVSLVDTDCDDGKADVNPGAKEKPFNGIDDDCAIGKGEISLADHDEKYPGSDSGDETGAALSYVGDMNGDTFPEWAIASPGKSSGDGSVSIYSDLTASVSLSGVDAEGFGAWVTGAGDLNGDGYDDVLVGAPSNTAGGAYILYGPQTASSFTDDISLLGTPGAFSAAGGFYFDTDTKTDFAVGSEGVVTLFDGDSLEASFDEITVSSAGNDFGETVSNVGDINGDGFEDLAVGAPESGSGSVFLYTDAAALSYDAELKGSATNDDAGYAVSGADIDGDGYSDVIVGAPKNDSNGVQSGAVYLNLGPISADQKLSNSNTIYLGESAGCLAGTSVSSGDPDGNGSLGVVIGEPGCNDGAYTETGKVFVDFGPVSFGTITSGSLYATIIGQTSGDNAGTAVDARYNADQDSDGYDDILIGAPEEDGAGAAYLLLGDNE